MKMIAMVSTCQMKIETNRGKYQSRITNDQNETKAKEDKKKQRFSSRISSFSFLKTIAEDASIVDQAPKWAKGFFFFNYLYLIVITFQSLVITPDHFLSLLQDLSIDFHSSLFTCINCQVSFFYYLIR